jgi:hypothetical protein
VPDEDDGSEHRTDEPPRPRKTRRTTRKGAHSVGVGRNNLSVKAQLQIPYQLAGQIAASRGLPHTGAILIARAPECAAAWDQFLKRFPAVYDMLEKGMVAGDIITLLWVHFEIVQTMRAEVASMQPTRTEYNPQEHAEPVPA